MRLATSETPPGIEKNMEHGIITKPGKGGTWNRREKGIDLLCTKRWHDFVGDVLGPDGTDSGVRRDHQCVSPRQITDKSGDGGQAVIAGFRAVAPLGFQIIEKV